MYILQAGLAVRLVKFAFVVYSLCVEKFLSSYPKDQLF